MPTRWGLRPAVNKMSCSRQETAGLTPWCSIETSSRWSQLAADQGHSEAQVHLGFKYKDGDGVPQDEAEAVRCVELTLAGVV